MPINTKCPTCKRAVEIPDELMGKKVRCPSCKIIFLPTAGAPPSKTNSSRPQPPKSKSEEGIRARRKPPPPEDEEDEDEEEEEIPHGRKKGVRRREEDEEEDEEEEEEEDEEEQEDEEEYRPRRKRRRFRRDMAPHRAGTILTLGIISLLCLPIIFGPMAWIMGNNDLKEMEAGRMDPSGEGMTRAGKICGIISIALMIASCVGWFLLFGVSFIRMAAHNQ